MTYPCRNGLLHQIIQQTLSVAALNIQPNTRPMMLLAPPFVI